MTMHTACDRSSALKADCLLQSRQYTSLYNPWRAKHESRLECFFSIGLSWWWVLVMCRVRLFTSCRWTCRQGRNSRATGCWRKLLHRGTTTRRWNTSQVPPHSNLASLERPPGPMGMQPSEAMGGARPVLRGASPGGRMARRQTGPRREEQSRARGLPDEGRLDLHRARPSAQVLPSSWLLLSGIQQRDAKLVWLILGAVSAHNRTAHGTTGRWSFFLCQGCLCSPCKKRCCNSRKVSIAGGSANAGSLGALRLAGKSGIFTALENRGHMPIILNVPLGSSAACWP